MARANPASTQAKPRFMKNTRMAARKTHRVSAMEYAISLASQIKLPRPRAPALRLRAGAHG